MAPPSSCPKTLDILNDGKKKKKESKRSVRIYDIRITKIISSFGPNAVNAN